MKFIRQVLGSIIIFFDSITRPKPIQRTEEKQKQVNILAKNYSLYQFHACPFCVKVRRTLHKLNLKIELCDARDSIHEDQLIKGGGKRKVPCLRIKDDKGIKWLYNSKDIISYLQNNFV